ncbi:pyridoxal phosphate-dependent decarboxylase family protein [Meridianimarinicoccus sp. RP-17]|uniref:pyridoxal phosphate-dependent decarboxylase family protein n=1 Tax=Meridianimarinicoccus zhengii TaxID=2056810 RepID=UPI000DAF13C2|nr:pyridoxal-dependent decarboxylase [Phycocomes zhengii]
MAHDGAADFLQKLRAFHAHGATQDRLSLAGKPGTSALSGWFLGPMGENRDLFRELVGMALDANCDAREAYGKQFGDPLYVTAARKALPGYAHTTDALRDNLREMLHDLHGSIPLSSYRNQSHMYWDVTLPGMVGYFAAMLYNQNNVAAEASPVTTLLEIEVGRDLCAMLGYDTPTEAEIHAGAIAPWGHITCDGSVANGESMWAARNLKLLPIALAAAIKGMPEMAAGRMLTVPCPTGGRAHLLDLDTWSLLNLRVDDVIALSPRLQSECGLDAKTIEAALNTHSVQALGLAEFQRRFLAADAPHLPVVITPATAHYSWPKSAALLGLGFSHVWKVPVDLDGRMSLVELRRMLDQCLREKRPVMEVVAVMGTTEESAVDPLADIVAMREEYRQMGLEFVLHVDGAWGGYFNSINRVPCGADPDGPVFQPDEAEAGMEHTPAMLMSDYVTRHYAALPHTDSQTVDPHKGGFIPYPAGALCYRNGAMRDLVAFTAPVVFHGGVDPTVGVYGIEGSKPGAAAAGVYLSHAIIRPDRSGYGKLLGKCIFNSKRLYAGLVSIGYGKGAPAESIRVVPFQRMPVEKAGGTAAELRAQLDFLHDEIVPRENDDLVAYLADNQDALQVFRDLGSDQNIITYAVNFRTAEGWNSDIGLMNELTNAIYRRLSISDFNGGTVPEKPMFVTASSFEVADYGQDFVDAFAARAGVGPTHGTGIQFLVSTTQDPWVTATAKGNYLPYVVDAFKRTALDCAAVLVREHGFTPFDGVA